MTGNQRNILVLTGTRAEYGLLKSTMEAIRGHEKLSLSIVATGMHLSPRHGMTVEEISEDGFTVDRKVSMQLDGDSGIAMAKSLGVGTMGLADAFASLNPDIILLLGDRDEALAGALAGAHMNIPVAHIHGGDAMNGAVIDDSIRHAITKFAHLHFPASERSAERIRKLGEEEWRINIAGAPGLDDVLSDNYDEPRAVQKNYNINEDKTLTLVVQHPVTTQHEQARVQMAQTLDAVEAVTEQAVIIYPNSDAGGEQIIDEIESRSFSNNIWTFKSLPRREYLGVMAAADLMIGNSSSGIIEAPSFDLPVVDIGPRQKGRERSDNTLSVAHDEAEIRTAIQSCLNKALQQRSVCATNPYNYDGACVNIVQRLVNVHLTESFLQKQITY